MPDDIFNLDTKAKPGKYVIQSVTATYPGWAACYASPDGGVVLFPVACLALVDCEGKQVVRHLVSTPTGEIVDATHLPDFICVLAPGQDPQAFIPALQKLQRQAQEDQQ